MDFLCSFLRIFLHNILRVIYHFWDTWAEWKGKPPTYHLA